MRRWITGLFDDLHEARMAVESLADVDGRRIGLIANNVADRHGPAPLPEGTVLAGVRTLLLKGVGPVVAAGPLAERVAQAQGADLSDLLLAMGVDPQRAGICAEAVRRGCTLVVLPVEAAEAFEAEWALQDLGAIDVERRVAAWRRYGWQSWDGGAAPLSAEELNREQELWYGFHGDNPYENRTREINVQLDANRERMSVRELEEAAARAWFVDGPLDAEPPANSGNWRARERKAS